MNEKDLIKYGFTTIAVHSIEEANLLKRNVLVLCVNFCGLLFRNLGVDDDQNLKHDMDTLDAADRDSHHDLKGIVF